MPLFEYECVCCGCITEELQARPRKKMRCPECFKPSHRKFSVAGIVINWANDLEHFGTPKHAKDRARKCGVEV